MPKRFGVLCVGLSAIFLFRCLPARAGDEGASLPSITLPSFGDTALDAALARLSRETELAVVQVDRLAALAAKQSGPAERSLEARERRIQEIAGILYSDQVEAFQQAYEAGLGADEGGTRQWARARLGVLFGRMEVNADLRIRALVALIPLCRESCQQAAALDAARKDAAPDADYRGKREALLAPLRTKSHEVIHALLPPGKQKEMDDEWKRRQERRIALSLKEWAGYQPQTEAARKKMDDATAAFRAAARDLDLDSPEFGACVDRLRRDLGGLLPLK